MLKGKTAVVTGSTSGIGLGIAEALAAEGCSLMLNGFRDKAEIERLRRGWGRIVNISSAHGLVASEGKVAYVAAKHGIIGLTKVVALDHANDGITCNAICPGWVLTPLVAQQITAQATQQGIPEQAAKE